MAEVPSQEANLRAVASGEQETKSGGSKLTPEQKTANKIRKTMAEKGARESVAQFLNRTPKKEDMTAQLEDNIGTTLDAAGKKVRTAEEQGRFNRAKESINRVYDYLDNGVDAMDSGARDVAREHVEQVFRMLPGANEYLNGLAPAEINKLMDEAMRDPNFRNKLLGKLDEVRGKGELADDEFRAAQDAVTEAEDAKKAKERQITNVETELTEVEEILEKFKAGGEHATRLDKLTDGMTELEVAAKSASGELANLNMRIASVNRQLDAIKLAKKGDITEVTEATKPFLETLEELEGKKAAEQSKIEALEKAKAEKKKLEDDRTQARTRRRELEKERDKIEEELDPLRLKHAQAERALAKARRARISQEGEFETSVNDLIKDAAVEYYKDRMTAAEEAQDKMLAEQVEKAKDAMEKRMLEQLSSRRWDQADTKGGIITRERKTIKINKRQVETDYQTLLTQGPEAVMRSILLADGLTEEEIDEKMKDGEFAKNAQDTMLRNLLARRIRTGKITENEAFHIGTSDWGAEAISQALNANSAVHGAVENLVGIGALKGDGPAEWIKNNPKKSFAAILLSALLGGAVSLVAIPALAAAGVTTGLGTAGSAAYQQYRNR